MKTAHAEDDEEILENVNGLAMRVIPECQPENDPDPFAVSTDDEA